MAVAAVIGVMNTSRSGGERIWSRCGGDGGDAGGGWWWWKWLALACRQIGGVDAFSVSFETGENAW